MEFRLAFLPPFLRLFPFYFVSQFRVLIVLVLNRCFTRCPLKYTFICPFNPSLPPSSHPIVISFLMLFLFVLLAIVYPRFPSVQTQSPLTRYKAPHTHLYLLRTKTILLLLLLNLQIASMREKTLLITQTLPEYVDLQTPLCPQTHNQQDISYTSWGGIKYADP